MSKIISAQVSGELEEEFAEAAERRGADESRSAFIRDVIAEGLRAREVPLFARLDLPNRMGARLEADREEGESQEAVIVRFLREAIEARDRDGLDELGVDDDLREAIEDIREDGEPIEDATRRVLREAVAERNQLQQENKELRVYQIIGGIMVLGMLGGIGAIALPSAFGIENQILQSLRTALISVSLLGAIAFALVPVSKYIEDLF